MTVIFKKLYTLLKYFKHHLFLTTFGFTSYCQHSPTCSQYLVISIKKEGLLKGSLKGIKRIASCR